jgi:cytochrome c-type biogenesis protein CcmH/NrfG
MVALLRRAIAAAPRLDSAGPHRVLALVLLRAPGWPVGPGDPEAALAHARAAASLAPGAAANQLVLGEALAANGRAGEARAAYRRAVELATQAGRMRDPEAARWLAEARSGLAKSGG